MRALVLFIAACGAKPPPEPLPPETGRAISIEWKATATDGDDVLVSIVVDGKAYDLGPLPAVDEMQRGPRTCALRSAHPLRTEFVCGELTSYYAAQLERGELVITLVTPEGTREILRGGVVGEGLAVAPYALPD